MGKWVVGFVDREGRNPTPVEIGKAHQTTTLATRSAKPGEAGLATSTLRAEWRTRADLQNQSAEFPYSDSLVVSRHPRAV